MLRSLRIAVAAVVICLSGCASFEAARSPDRALVELAPSDYPLFADDLDFEGLADALAQSETHLLKLVRFAPERTVRFGAESVPVRKVLETVEKLQTLVRARPTPGELQVALRKDFRVFRSTGGDEHGTVVFTGYFLPELRGSLVASETFRYPLHARPGSMVTVRAKDFPGLGGDIVGFVDQGRLVPLPDRSAIAAGALDDKTTPIVWVDSLLDAFFLHIQGSGVVRLPDGSTRVVSYAGKNGHPYRAIGGELVRRGALRRDEVSMQSIRAWLEANPSEQDAVLHTNPSYVFFELGDAPRGSLGVPVTPDRTIATDPGVFPKGAPAFIQTRRPVDVNGSVRDFARFVVDQDTGSAIRSAARVDLYFGSGEYAAYAAGHLNEPGQLYYLLAR